MDSGKFNLLMTVLDGLEEEYFNDSTISRAINKIITQFEDNLSDEQKDRLSMEFDKYWRAKTERNFEIIENEITL